MLAGMWLCCVPRRTPQGSCELESHVSDHVFAAMTEWGVAQEGETAGRSFRLSRQEVTTLTKVVAGGEVRTDWILVYFESMCRMS